MTDNVIKTLKRMKTFELDAEEFYAVDAAIKSLEAMSKMKGVLKSLASTLREPADKYDEAYTDGYKDALGTITDILKGVER